MSIVILLGLALAAGFSLAAHLPAATGAAVVAAPQLDPLLTLLLGKGADALKAFAHSEIDKYIGGVIGKVAAPPK